MRSWFLGLLLAGCSSAPRYVGPVTDHFDGKQFHNLAPFEERGFGHVLRWKLSGKRAVSWPRYVEVPAAEQPPERVTTSTRITFVNHATVLIQMGGLNILTDPVWSPSVGPTSVLGQRRHKPAGISFAALPPIDLVLISHNHYDHLDLPTLQMLQRRDAPLILCGLGTARLLREHGVPRGRDLDWWQSVELGDVTVTFAPAQHWSMRGATDRNRNLWGSFYLTKDSRRIYFAGDTGAGPHFEWIRQRLGAPDVALLPIGAYLPRWFMKPQHIDPGEAVAAAQTLGASRSVAIHFGTFQQTDEGMDDPVKELQRVLKEKRLPDNFFTVLEHGQSLTMDE